MAWIVAGSLAGILVPRAGGLPVSLTVSDFALKGVRLFTPVR